MMGRIGLLAITGCWLVLALGWMPASADDLSSVEKRKIEALIGGVEQMTDAVFIRNGKSYSAALAAEFLRRKWKSRREEVRSAADFIDQVASFSSTTGRPYRIRWGEGKERLSAEFFKARLALLEGA
jgi:hypothetical protein